MERGGYTQSTPISPFYFIIFFYIQNVLLRQVKKVWGVGGGLDNKRRKK
jgi:hypothetical protein